MPLNTASYIAAIAKALMVPTTDTELQKAERTWDGSAEWLQVVRGVGVPASITLACVAAAWLAFVTKNAHGG